MRGKTAIRSHAVFIAAVGFCLVASLHGVAQTQALEPSQAGIARGQAFNGSWVINESLSDNTDDAVEAAIKKAGGKVKRRFLRKRPEDFYRGGPAEQELYDRISYDDVLFIAIDEPELRFEYADNFVRLFHSDGRRRRTTANSFYEEGADDFSFANWNGDTLIVEARPRDGGFTLETYTLIENGARLRIEMLIEPDAFGAAIELVRVFDRVAEN